MEGKKYRKKPVEIEAIQWTGNNWPEIASFAYGCCKLYNKCLFINTLEGQMTAETDDYIIKGVAGEFYSCKPDIFEQTYELID